MARTDILINPDSVDVVTANGVLNVTESPDIKPTLALDPDNATLQLGCYGEGENGGNGKAKFVTRDGETRITVNSNGIPNPNEDRYNENVVSIGVRDESGTLDLARIHRGPDEPRERESTVQLSADEGMISLGGNHQSGYLTLTGGSGHPQSTISLNGRKATVAVGGSPGTRPGTDTEAKAGSIKLVDVQNTATVSIEGGSEDGQGGEGSGGSIQLGDSDATSKVHIQADGGREGGMISLRNASRTTVVVDGGTGTMVLGEGTPGTIQHRGNPENGELWLDDGNGKKFGLKAENGTVGLGPSSDLSGMGLVLKPEKGVFSIADGNGNPIFRINTKNKTVEINNSYNFNP
jgi:hypothetical protein